MITGLFILIRVNHKSLVEGLDSTFYIIAKTGSK